MNFHSDFKENFIEGIKDVKNNVVNLGGNIKSGVKKTFTNIK